ncbi:MAG: hypothetical protein AAFX03_08225 [Pseudomonadota bacterium]
MSTASFQSFLTGGIGLLIVAAMAIAWLLWRERDYRMASHKAALGGVGQELKIALQRVLDELMQLSYGRSPGRGAFMPMGRPQLDAVNAALIETNRQAISVIGAFYEELEIRKLELRAAMAEGEDHEDLRRLCLESCVEGIATLFLWDVYDGVAPQDAPTTRSWDVRAWMKGHGFGRFEFPDLHLRDAVVELLRAYGMHLTPRPLTHTAHEYWSMRYDRQADPRGVFGRRKIAPAIVDEQTDEAADYVGDEPPRLASAEEAPPEPSPPPEPAQAAEPVPLAEPAPAEEPPAEEPQAEGDEAPPVIRTT